jgi:hypothetical protein
MKQFFQSMPYFFVGFIIVVFGFLLGRYMFPNTARNSSETVSTRSIVQSISSQGFLVTQMIIAEHKVSYKVDKGSDWSNFWWGHLITARATTATSFGIDLAKLDESMVNVDSVNRNICFEYPTPAIQSSSLSGEIEVETSSGLFKRIFASDANNDYNLALSLLKEESEKAVTAMESAKIDAYKQADKTIAFMLNSTEYSVIDDCRR